MLCQPEQGGPFHDRVGPIGKELLVLGEQVPLPELMAEPGSAGGPDAVVGVVDGGGPAPEVEVVVEHPALGVVVGPGGARTGGRHLGEGVEQPALLPLDLPSGLLDD